MELQIWRKKITYKGNHTYNFLLISPEFIKNREDHRVFVICGKAKIVTRKKGFVVKKDRVLPIFDIGIVKCKQSNKALLEVIPFKRYGFYALPII